MPRWVNLLLCTAVAMAMAAPAAAEPAAAPYWSDTWRGWHFYEQPEDEEPPVRAPRTALPSPHKPKRAPELVEFELLQRSLEELRQIAIIRPSEANVRRYMELEAQVVAQASHFADVAQRVAWTSPDLDPSLQGRPVNAKALEVFEQQQLADRSRTVQNLASDHALIFVFRGDCPYCHAFAPTLDSFRRRYGLQVLAVSLDGGALPGFSDARRDNGIASNLQVSQVPAVYLAQPFTGVITPVGFGVMSEAQLLERIAVVASGPADPADSGSRLKLTASAKEIRR